MGMEFTIRAITAMQTSVLSLHTREAFLLIYLIKLSTAAIVIKHDHKPSHSFVHMAAAKESLTGRSFHHSWVTVFILN